MFHRDKAVRYESAALKPAACITGTTNWSPLAGSCVVEPVGYSGPVRPQIVGVVVRPERPEFAWQTGSQRLGGAAFRPAVKSLGSVPSPSVVLHASEVESGQ